MAWVENDDGHLSDSNDLPTKRLGGIDQIPLLPPFPLVGGRCKLNIYDDVARSMALPLWNDPSIPLISSVSWPASETRRPFPNFENVMFGATMRAEIIFGAKFGMVEQCKMQFSKNGTILQYKENVWDRAKQPCNDRMNEVSPSNSACRIEMMIFQVHPRSLTVRPSKVTETQEERLVFQPPFFRVELLNFGGGRNPPMGNPYISPTVYIPI